MKKLITVFVSMFILAALSFASFAAEEELVDTSSSESFNRFSNYISELFSSDQKSSSMSSEGERTVTYQFIDKEGNDITDEFISDISNKAITEQYELFKQKVAHAIKRTEIVTRAGDLSKTVEEDIYHSCTAITIDGARWDQIASSALTGEVYYRLEVGFM